MERQTRIAIQIQNSAVCQGRLGRSGLGIIDMEMLLPGRYASSVCQITPIWD